MTDPNDLHFPTPFHLKESRSGWHGEAKSIDGAATDLFTEEDVEAVVYSYDSGDDWDGDCAALLRLKDGRLVAWESWWGPTGDGFSEDAYGGDTDIWFAKPEGLNTLILQAFSDETRRKLGIPEAGLS